MHALIWCPPWAGQDSDLFFAFNAFKKHLLVQASTLRAKGWKVSVVCPSAYKVALREMPSGLEVVELDSMNAVAIVGGWADPAASLYAEPYGELSNRIAEWLRPQLPKSVDCVLLWETPCSFLRALYPEATIASQMPGAFARAPYPQMTIIDPMGLYRESLLSVAANEIKTSQRAASIVSSVKSEVRKVFYSLPYGSKNTILSRAGAERFALLPLQVSDHYAFKVETKFATQAEYCTSALSLVDPATAIYATEYVSRLYRDQVLSPEFVAFLQHSRPNFIFDPRSAEVPSVSQHILQFADELITTTSGLCFQAMVWDVPVKIAGDTHLSPYDARFVNEVDTRERVLSYLFTRHQPLNELITTDGDFLVHLLEEMHARRNKTNIERTPDFTSLHPNYHDKVLQNFRAKDTEKSFVKLGLTVETPSKATQFTEILRKNNPTLISFDLFDTLVTRGFEQPADLYLYLEKDLRASGVKTPFDFAAKRLEAELTARINARKEEITLDDIYAELAKAEGLSFAQVEELRDRELEIEVASCHIRPIGRSLYDQAKETEIQLCVTSDMYLPRSAIDAILLKNGYQGIRLIYLSSEIGLTKKSGALFHYIASQNNIHPRNIVHVGDNEKTDVKSAISAGATSFHIPRAVDYLRGHSIFSSAFTKRPPITNLGRSVTAAAIGRTLFDDPKAVRKSISNGDPWMLGYATLGPLIYGFASWLRASALEHNISDLHFLSREGKIFKDAFDRIEKASPSGIRSNYLWGSRRAIRVAQMRSVSDIIEVGNQTIDRTATLQSLLKSRFGLDLKVVQKDHLRQAGFKSLQDEIGSSPVDKTRFIKLLTALQSEILAVSMREGEAYRAYLASQGLFDGRNLAVVDVGWNANMQGSLGQIIGKPITGYYVATLPLAARWKAIGHKIHAYHLDECANTANEPLLSNRIVAEALLCDITPTLLGVKRDPDGNFSPKFAKAEPTRRVQLIRAVQDGARSFVDDVCRVLGTHAGTTAITPDVSLALLESFLANPHLEDARLLEGQELEDAFSGARKRYLLAPFNNGKPSGSSYWRAGERSLEKGSEAPKSNGNLTAHTKTLRVSDRVLMPFVRPFVAKIGNKKDVEEFNSDPSAFFASLRNRRYRQIGAILFRPH